MLDLPDKKGWANRALTYSGLAAEGAIQISKLDYKQGVFLDLVR